MFGGKDNKYIWNKKIEVNFFCIFFERVLTKNAGYECFSVSGRREVRIVV
jgi:hypothetical protein